MKKRNYQTPVVSLTALEVEQGIAISPGQDYIFLDIEEGVETDYGTF